ncbi:MAG: hypothetical protein AB7C89_06635 [Intestinibacillus sp.]
MQKVRFRSRKRTFFVPAPKFTTRRRRIAVDKFARTFYNGVVIFVSHQQKRSLCAGLPRADGAACREKKG